MDNHERELLLRNPFIKLVLDEVRRTKASHTKAAEVALNRELDAPPPHDDELLAVERALNVALGKLPHEATKSLFAGTLDIRELSDVFSLTVSQLSRSARETDEAKALSLEHLWSWYWQRDVVAYRRFLLSGRKDHSLLDQLPSFWRPGIEARPFWSLDQLPREFVSLEENASTIRDELNAVLDDGAWLPYAGVRGVRDQPLEPAVESDWNGFFFYHPFRGRFAANHERCPVTSRVLEGLPGLCRRELVLFSALVPGGVVPPHQGPFNGRLRVHLALTGSDGCYLRVGTQIREWEDGRVLVFDDSFEHQVCHNGPALRVVLMFNIVQPGMRGDVVDRAAQSTTEEFVESPEDVAVREALARTAWWK